MGRSVVRSGSNYTANLTWLVARKVAGRKLKVVRAFVLGQLSIFAQAAAVGTLYWYAAQTQSDATVSLGPLGIELRAREDLLLLGAVVATSAACFLASAGFIYSSEKTLIGIVEEGLARGLTEIVRIAKRLPDPRAPEASQILLDKGLTKIAQGCKHGASATLMLLSTVSPMVGGIAAGGALVVIDPLLTTMLGVGAILWSMRIYPLLRRQVKYTDRLARGKSAFVAESRWLLHSPSPAEVPAEMGSAVTLSAVLNDRRRTEKKIRLVLQLGVSVIGALAALYLAYRIIDGNGNWPIFIVYLGGLRIALNGCFAVPRTFGNVSRFYPRLVVFMRFLQGAARMDAEPLGRAEHGDTLLLGTLPDGATASAGVGDRIALAALGTHLEIQAAFIGARVATTDLPVAAAWVHPAELEVRQDAQIRLVEADVLAEMDPGAAVAFLNRMNDGVTGIVYRHESRIGAFNEPQLMLIEDATLVASVGLGTTESADVLERFAQIRAVNAAQQAVDSSMMDEEDEEE